MTNIDPGYTIRPDINGILRIDGSRLADAFVNRITNTIEIMTSQNDLIEIIEIIDGNLKDISSTTQRASNNVIEKRLKNAIYITSSEIIEKIKNTHTQEQPADIDMIYLASEELARCNRETPEYTDIKERMRYSIEKYCAAVADQFNIKLVSTQEKESIITQRSVYIFIGLTIFVTVGFLIYKNMPEKCLVSLLNKTS